MQQVTVIDNCRFIVAGAVAATLAACSDQYMSTCDLPTCVRLEGEVSAEHLEVLQSHVGLLDTVVLKSKGGRSVVAVQVAMEILRQDLHVRIDDLCASACAEFLMKAGKSVAVSDHSLILFHYGSLRVEAARLREGIQLPENCTSQVAELSKLIYLARGLNTDFHLEMDKRLGELTIETELSRGCPVVSSVDQEIDFWIPSSNQLRTLLGIDISGRLCADDPEACAASLDLPGPPKRCVLVDKEVPC